MRWKSGAKSQNRSMNTTHKKDQIIFQFLLPFDSLFFCEKLFE